MNRRSIVIATAAAGIAVFTAGAFWSGQSGTPPASTARTIGGDALVRPHSPILGHEAAPVTIVEFFDPSCEACRAFHPIVKQIMDAFPGKVRVVIRYTPFHEGSDEAVRILETARQQRLFLPVLEALLVRQPEWAVHGAPNLALAWEIARTAGLDVDRARGRKQAPEITAVLEQDVADVVANGVNRTPTFFVNGKPLPSFGPQQLYDMVRGEVERLPAS